MPRPQFTLRALLVAMLVVTCLVALPIGFYGSVLVSLPVTEAVNAHFPADRAEVVVPLVEAMMAWGWVFFFAWLAYVELRRGTVGFKGLVPAALAVGACPAAFVVSVAAAYLLLIR